LSSGHQKLRCEFGAGLGRCGCFKIDETAAVRFVAPSNPARLSRVKRTVVAVLVMVALGGCLGKFGRPLEQRTSHGPTARQFWMMKQFIANDREPSIDERRHWEDQLDLQIAQYLRQNPEAANALHVSAFRFDKQVVT